MLLPHESLHLLPHHYVLQVLDLSVLYLLCHNFRSHLALVLSVVFIRTLCSRRVGSDIRFSGRLAGFVVPGFLARHYVTGTPGSWEDKNTHSRLFKNL